MKYLLTSKSFKISFLCIILSLSFLVTSVSAEEWESVPISDARVLWCISTTTDGKFVDITDGYYSTDIPYYPDMSWFALSAKIPIYPDCTYEITFEVNEATFYIWNSPIEYSFNLVPDKPVSVGSLAEQYNSAGERYIDCCHFEGTETDRRWSFSTADGFIDNLDSGYYYVTFSELIMPYTEDNWCEEYEEVIYFDVKSISVSCIMDPGAGYFTEKVIEDLNAKAEQLESVGSALSEQETWLINKSQSLRDSVKDDWDNMLADVNSLVRPATRSGNSLLGGASTLGTIFRSFTLSLPPVLSSVMCTIPVLYFIAWLVGRRE